MLMIHFGLYFFYLSSNLFIFVLIESQYLLNRVNVVPSVKLVLVSFGKFHVLKFISSSILEYDTCQNKKDFKDKRLSKF